VATEIILIKFYLETENGVTEETVVPSEFPSFKIQDSGGRQFEFQYATGMCLFL